jgi:Cu+-exporting ATPase
MSIHIENMLCNFWDCLSEAMYPEQVGNRKLITESGISIPTNVERFLVELEESAKTGILVAYDDNLLGVLGVADPLKREAAVVVEGLGKMGVTTVMVTGDNWRTARAVAKEVSIEFLFVSNLNPRF